MLSTTVTFPQPNPISVSLNNMRELVFTQGELKLTIPRELLTRSMWRTAMAGMVRSRIPFLTMLVSANASIDYNGKTIRLSAGEDHIVVENPQWFWHLPE